jgi:PucR C-terminal helix-turn-helix domain
VTSIVADMRHDKAPVRQQLGAYPAGSMQDQPAPPYLLALVSLTADEDALEALAAAVARDVARGAPVTGDDRDAARGAVEWLLASLRVGPVPDALALQALRDGAAAQARSGGPLQPVLDRTLSAGWVLWAAATERGLGADGLTALGEALLRTGDAAATAIADAHASAEREIATRSASSLRELLDALLELGDADEPGRARLVRRAGELAIPVDRSLTVVVVDTGADLEDGDAGVVEVARRLGAGALPAVGDPRVLAGARPRPVVAATHGLLVVMAPAARTAPDIRGALRALGEDWVAVSAEAASFIAVGAAAREATAVLPVARRLGRVDVIVRAASLALERALLAEPGLLAMAVDRELGPLLRAPRSAGLVETVEAYLAERENIRAAGRRLGVAPRTVAYRLERVERILGGRLDADRRLRLATALFARRLLEPAKRSARPTATGRRAAGPPAAAGPPR